MRSTEHYLIDMADECVQLARAGREMAAKLEVMSDKLMAKAVELDTAKQRGEQEQSATVRKSARK
jgi:hypothetical protein